MTIDVTVPDIGDFSDVEIIEVLVAEGDEVEEEASLITLESDKATMEIPSPVNGRVVSLKVAVGDRVYVTLGYRDPVTALDAAVKELIKPYKRWGI